MPGVTVVRDGDFVGVAAPDEPTAAQALAAIRAEWKTTPQSVRPGPVPATSRSVPRRSRSPRGPTRRGTGSIEDGLAAADVKLDATYTIAYIAHAPLEPRAAVAEWTDGKLTVWTGTQRPFGVRGELAAGVRRCPRTGSA